jgi:uncharacterized surface protein with fasciclin (FAS1) repeats
MQSKKAMVQTAALLLCAAMLVTPALANGKSAAAKAAKPGPDSIVGIATSAEYGGTFNVLVAAVVRAELADVLAGPGQFTVFAPTDAAFIALFGVDSAAEAIAEINVMEEDVLANILLFHVTGGRRTSTSVVAAPEYEMLNGDILEREYLVGALNLDLLNISASNGVIHVLNSVLIPPAE